MNENMQVTLQSFFDKDAKQYGVLMTVYGLTSQEQADRAMEYIQQQFCGTEQKVN